MRNYRVVLLCVLIVAAVPTAAQRSVGPGDQFVGTWSGTWDGAGSGGFTLILEKDEKGSLAAKVAVTGEPTYDATLKALSFDGAKMTGTYDFPPDPGGEIRLTASFDGNKASGTWALHEKASGTELASGGWTVSKK